MLSMLLSSNFNNYFWRGCLVIFGASCWRYQEYRRPLLRTSLYDGVSQLSERAIFESFCVANMYCIAKTILRLCHTLYPSRELELNKFIDRFMSSMYTKHALKYRDEEFRTRRTGIAKFEKDIQQFMDELDARKIRGVVFKLSLKKASAENTNKVLDQASAVAGNVSALVGYISEVHEKAKPANNPSLSFLLAYNDIAMHAPVVGIAFAILKPVLNTFVEANKAHDKVASTSIRITQLIQELNKTLEHAKGERISFAAKEMEEIDTLIEAIKDGIDVVGKVMQSSQSRVGRLLNIEDHKAKLNGWMSATQQMLERDQRNNIRLAVYRLTYIKETQRRYFACLTILSVANLVVGLAVLYFVLTILNIVKADPLLVRWAKQVFVYAKMGSEKMKLGDLVKTDQKVSAWTGWTM